VVIVSPMLTVMSNFSEDRDKGISESAISDCGICVKSRQGCNLDDFIFIFNLLIFNYLKTKINHPATPL
jgi:hypothetical protein